MNWRQEREASFQGRARVPLCSDTVPCLFLLLPKSICHKIDYKTFKVLSFFKDVQGSPANPSVLAAGPEDPFLKRSCGGACGVSGVIWRIWDSSRCLQITSYLSKDYQLQSHPLLKVVIGDCKRIILWWLKDVDCGPKSKHKRLLPTTLMEILVWESQAPLHEFSPPHPDEARWENQVVRGWSVSPTSQGTSITLQWTI